MVLDDMDAWHRYKIMERMTDPLADLLDHLTFCGKFHYRALIHDYPSGTETWFRAWRNYTRINIIISKHRPR